MPIVNPAHDSPRIGSGTVPGVNIVTWAHLHANDQGAPIQSPHFGDRTIQFVGNFDGATIKLKGSNTEANGETLTDPQGNDIVKTGADLEAITEVTAYIWPEVEGGGGACDITAILLVRAPQ